MLAPVLTQSVYMLTEPLVKTGTYISREQALKHIILDYLERQIAWAEAQLREYERRHHCTFAEWSVTLANHATTDDEDEWMAWEAARDMLVGWQQIHAEVAQSAV